MILQVCVTLAHQPNCIFFRFVCHPNGDIAQHGVRRCREQTVIVESKDVSDPHLSMGSVVDREMTYMILIQVSPLELPSPRPT